MKEQVLIFANPIAGKGRAKRIAGVLEEALKARGYAVKVFLSKMESTETKRIAGRIKAAIVKLNSRNAVGHGPPLQVASPEELLTDNSFLFKLAGSG